MCNREQNEKHVPCLLSSRTSWTATRVVSINDEYVTSLPVLSISVKVLFSLLHSFHISICLSHLSVRCNVTIIIIIPVVTQFLLELKDSLLIFSFVNCWGIRVEFSKHCRPCTGMLGPQPIILARSVHAAPCRPSVTRQGAGSSTFSSCSRRSHKAASSSRIFCRRDGNGATLPSDVLEHAKQCVHDGSCFLFWDVGACP